MATTPSTDYSSYFAHEFDNFLLEMGLEAGRIVVKQHLGGVETVEVTMVFTRPQGPSRKTQLRLQAPLTRLSDFCEFALIRLQEMLAPLKMPYGRFQFEIAQQKLRETFIGEKLWRGDLDRLSRYLAEPSNSRPKEKKRSEDKAPRAAEDGQHPTG